MKILGGLFLYLRMVFLRDVGGAVPYAFGWGLVFGMWRVLSSGGLGGGGCEGVMDEVGCFI